LICDKKYSKFLPLSLKIDIKIGFVMNHKGLRSEVALLIVDLKWKIISNRNVNFQIETARRSQLFVPYNYRDV